MTLIRSYIQFSAVLLMELLNGDLENWARGRSVSLKMAPFDRPHRTSYCSAIVNITLFGIVLELFDVE